MPGPAPQPTAIKKLRGNPGRRPLNDKEPKVDGRPRCPSWISKYAKAHWKYIVPKLGEMGVIGDVDQSILVAYCQAYGDVREAEEMLQREGVKKVFQSHTGNYLPNPWVTMKKHARQDMVRYAIELGLTPSARSRIKVDKPEEEPSLADILFKAADGKKQ